MASPTPGLPGLTLIALATAGTGLAFAAAGAWLPALACGAAVVVGLWAVQSVNK